MMATMKIAAPELLAFSLAILVLMAVCAEAHGTQFGVFTQSYSNVGGAGLTIYDMSAKARGQQMPQITLANRCPNCLSLASTARRRFANGASFEAGGEDLEHNPTAYILLYLFITLGLFLILAQYFIAILVGAFDEANNSQPHNSPHSPTASPPLQRRH